MCSGSEEGSYLRLIDSCITQLKAQGPSRTCDESNGEEEEGTTHVIPLLFNLASLRFKQVRNMQRFRGGLVFEAHRLLYHSTLGLIVIMKKKKQRE